jgi:hypothetical protein
MEFPDFCLKIREYCHVTGASVTSWIRTPMHNAVVGGVPASRHLLGLAVDVVYNLPTPEGVTRQGAADALGLHLIIEHDHDHVEAGPA